jgi:threonine dehydrogenase-like Zn-dependent dehydrogenase
MKPEHGIFVGLGTVALDALITSNIRFSENAVIFGQGVVGLLLLQLCKLAGVSPVIVVDMIDKRLSMSKRLGADYTLNPQTCDVASEVRGILGPGCDVVFETSGNIKALHESIRCGAPRYSKVLAVAWYQGPAQNLYLGEEFHHGLGACQIISAGPGIHARLPSSPGRQWDEVRVVKTFFKLLAEGKVQVGDLITHRFNFEEAEKAYELIDRHPEDIIKVLLTFSR